MVLDWNGVVGGAREVLTLVPGLSEPAFKQWRARKVLRLSVADTGSGPKVATYRASDVLQTAAVFELSQHTALVGKAPWVWLLVQRALMRRQFPGPDSGRREVLILAIGADGLLQDFSVDEADAKAVDRAMSLPGAPMTATLLHVDRLIDDVAARIAALRPATVH